MGVLTAIKGKKVIINGEIKEATILISNGVIVGIKDYDHQLSSDVQLLRDCKENEVLMGGLVDSHVHVNEPGRTDWEGFATATSAAAAGGVTTIIDMPLNSTPVTTSYDSLLTKIESMKSKCFIDVGLLGGIVPDNVDEIKKMVLEGGVVGFKSFMVHSGIDDFQAVRRADIERAMQVMSTLRKDGKDVVMMFHAEIPEPIDEACEKLKGCDPNSYNTFLESRPKSSENMAIDMVIDLTKKNHVRTHIVHLSSSEAVESLKNAIESGLPISAETTFHYLFFIAEQIPHGATLYKCCPPIRESDNRDQLWDALKQGTVGMIVSDHSPCTLNLKLLEQGDFMKAWGGISSLQLGLSIIWTEFKRRGIPMAKLSEWMSDRPAALVNLNDRKGSIKLGRDADFVVFDPEQEFTVDQTKLFVKNRSSPYHGSKLYGRILETILRGHSIYTDKNGHINEVKGERLIPTNIHSSPIFPTPYLPPIERLNYQDRPSFFNMVHLLFETAPPLVDPIYNSRPYSSYQELIEKANSVIQQCTEQEKIEIIDAHPRIGVNPAEIKSQSTLSFKEQGCHNEALEQQQLEAVYEELKQLNQQYEDKYGFKFVVFVNGRSKAEIIPVLLSRLENSNKQDELNLGLSEMIQIAHARLKKLVN